MSAELLEKFIDKRQTYLENIDLLKEQVSNNLILTYNEGIFKAEPELISFISCFDDNSDGLIVLDLNETPIKIEKVSDFKQEIIHHYTMVMNRYHKSYVKLKDRLV